MRTTGHERAQQPRWKVGALVACLLSMGVGVERSAAAEGSTDRADFNLEFASRAPGSPTTASLHLLYKAPGDPQAKPSPIRRAVIEAPAGTSFGLDRVPPCDATDEELRMSGRSACPSPTQVGAGSLTVVTGFGPPFDPFPAAVTLFNTGTGFLELVEQEQPRATLAVDRATVKGSTATLAPPSTPGGPPDGQTAVREIDLRFDRPEYLTTPGRCPKDGSWRSRGTFTFADGVTVSVPSTTPCAARARQPRLRLSVTPRRVRIGRTTRFRFRARSVRRQCVKRALVTFAGRRVRTDRRGRASIRIRLGRSGKRRTVVRHPACVRGRAVVHAIRLGRSAPSP